MKNHFREFIGFLVISLSLFSFVTAYAASAKKEDDGAGKKIFESKCAQCHGKDAKGVAKMAKVLKVEPINVDLTRPEAVKLKTAEIETIVTNGKDKMPKYKGKLTDAQIKDVAKYLRTIQGSEDKK